MSEFALVFDGDSQYFHLKGELSFKTVYSVLTESEKLFLSASELQVDLAGVTRSDSAGLALLLEWMRLASSTDRPIYFRNIPAQMMAIAAMSGFDKLLPTDK